MQGTSCDVGACYGTLLISILSNGCFLFSRGFSTLNSSWEKAAAWFKRQNSSLRLGFFSWRPPELHGNETSFFSFHLKFFLWKKIAVCGIRLVWKGNIDITRLARFTVALIGSQSCGVVVPAREGKAKIVYLAINTIFPLHKTHAG